MKIFSLSNVLLLKIVGSRTFSLFLSSHHNPPSMKSLIKFSFPGALGNYIYCCNYSLIYCDIQQGCEFLGVGERKNIKPELFS